MTYRTKKGEELLALLRTDPDRVWTPAQICARMSPDGAGESTLYRHLSRLVASGQVRRLCDGHTRHFSYQYIGEDTCAAHLHLKCTVCGRLIHLEGTLTRALENALRAQTGFETDDRNTLLYGRCAACVARGKEEED